MKLHASTFTGYQNACKVWRLTRDNSTSSSYSCKQLTQLRSQFAKHRHDYSSISASTTEASPSSTASSSTTTASPSSITSKSRSEQKQPTSSSSSPRRRRLQIQNTTSIRFPDPPALEPLSISAHTQSKLASSSSSPSATHSSSRRGSVGSKLEHYDFDSFLDHLERTGKSTTSPTSVGTLYEYATIAALEWLGIQPLTRCGRSGDNGIDIVGTCHVSAVQTRIEELRPTTRHSIFQVITKSAMPDNLQKENEKDSNNVDAPKSDRAFNVIVQCKASEKSVGSLLMREMAGAYFGFVNSDFYSDFNSSIASDFNSRLLPSQVSTASPSTSTPTLVLVITAGGRLTAPAFRQLEASHIPMVYMSLDKPRCVSESQHQYNPLSYKLANISQVTPNKLAKEFLRAHGLSFRTVRSYTLKPRERI